MYSTYYTKHIKQEKDDFDEVTNALEEGDEVKRESYIEDSRVTEQPRQDSCGIPNLDETEIKHEPVDAGMKIEAWDELEEDINFDPEHLSAYDDGSENRVYVKEEQQEDISAYENGSVSNGNVSNKNYFSSSSIYQYL